MTTKSRWSSLWGPRSPEATATVEALKAEHAEVDAAKLQDRPVDPNRRTDMLGRAAAIETGDEEDADGNPIRPPEYTLRVPRYGGITVKRASDATGAFLGILALCEKHLPAWDSTLTRFGVLVAQLDENPKIAFFVRRTRDGGTIAVPDARTKEEALLQIVQALLELQVRHRALLEAGGVTVFRNA